MAQMMTDHLQRVLDGLSGSERRALLRAAEAADSQTPMARILHAIATELRVRQLAEDELFRGLERDHAEEMDRLHANHPLVRELRAQRAAKARLMAQLKLPDSERGSSRRRIRRVGLRWRDGASPATTAPGSAWRVPA